MTCSSLKNGSIRIKCIMRSFVLSSKIGSFVTIHIFAQENSEYHESKEDES
uniref:Uncharacterized protein n=1 Tax=Lepeophtheirus salmonis TaxID=72036 RepID=A0A0K2TM42_LEPSM